MCGICGVVSLEGPLDPAVRHAVPAMTHALRHRGPDGQGVKDFPQAVLGHRRLAIIDRAGGSQPLANEDGTVWITFNGEVYNHHDLRRTLIGRGHQFRTVSDTEAILHAYEEYGAACVDRLEGMFAFAIYDTRRHELFIARDRLGKKPLFYAVFNGVLHFGSEIKALRPSPLWDDATDLSALEGYLSLGYFLAPGTIYRHVRKLEPGHWMRLRNGQIEVRQYWDVEEFDSDRRTEAAVSQALETTLRAVTQERLESEVPLGAFLSGGIDSGLVVAFMSEGAADPVVTTSVGFGDLAHNELDRAQLTAARLGTRHYAEVVQPDLHSVLDTVVSAFDEPFADSSAIPTYYVSEMARRHVTVALSGDGGDEAFGGYSFRYVPHALEQRVRGYLPTAMRPWVSKMGGRWPRSTRVPRALRWGNLLENVATEPEAAYYADLCFLKPAGARLLQGRAPDRDPRQSPVYEAVTAPYRRCRSRSVLQRAQYADLKIYLANDVLVKVDRMSMVHGLEVRCPLLDRRIVEFAFRVPTETKMPRLRPKYLLRQLAYRRLPAEVTSAPKHGFTAPVGKWIGGDSADAFRSDVFGPQSFVSTALDAGVVRRLFDEHVSGRAEHSYALWAIWALERWSRVTRTEPVRTGA